ncbi:hypothetical protein AAG906_017444 [Vitis piasezkii]
MSVANIGKLQENTDLCKIGVKLSGLKDRICISGEVETSSFPIRLNSDVIHPGGKWQPDGIPTRQDPILLVFWICLWIPKNSPQSRIALVIKKLSKHQNLTQFD